VYFQFPTGVAGGEGGGGGGGGGAAAQLQGCCSARCAAYAAHTHVSGVCAVAVLGHDSKKPSVGACPRECPNLRPHPVGSRSRRR